MITRFAPTPSGYLHLGNAANAILVSWLAQQHGGTLILRIDDMDATRVRREYVEDVFTLLTWLHVPWQSGPEDVDDFDAGFSMRRRTEYYRAELRAAQARGLEVYACTCSRSQLTSPATGGCPGGCRTAALPYEVGRTALRAHVPRGTLISVDGAVIPVDEVIGDAVLWRRDDLPAYHLASVVEDRDAAVTHVVRGRDLVESTALQLFLAPYLGAEGFVETAFVHHGLVTGNDGAKLSKSQLSTGGRLPRTEQQRDEVLRTAAALGVPHGIASAT